jgi:superfamily II DNA or RNA helicase
LFYFDRGDKVDVAADVFSNEEIQEKLALANDWGLIIVDEAHRMSASVFGNEVTRTKRYQLGQKLGGMCRHLGYAWR